MGKSVYLKPCFLLSCEGILHDGRVSYSVARARSMTVAFLPKKGPLFLGGPLVCPAFSCLGFGKLRFYLRPCVIGGGVICGVAHGADLVVGRLDRGKLYADRFYDICG